MVEDTYNPETTLWLMFGYAALTYGNKFFSLSVYYSKETWLNPDKEINIAGCPYTNGYEFTFFGKHAYLFFYPKHWKEKGFVMYNMAG